MRYAIANNKTGAPRFRGLHRLVLAILLCLGVGMGLPVLADFPPPVQTFYIPMPEDDYLNVLNTIEDGQTWIAANLTPADPMYTYPHISVFSDNTIIYFDHWENGFDASINNPLNIYDAVTNTGGTQIWGDDDASNGIPPGFVQDVLDFGSIIRLENSVVSTNRSVINFDGSDKIASTKPIAVTWAGWASGSQTLFAGALEVFDTTFWGTDYLIPVGEDIASDITTGIGEIFQYVGLSIMAGADGATIQIDADADGVYETTNTLTEGEAYLQNGGVQVGASVISDGPVQIDMVTGDVYDGYESRFFRLLPVNYWSAGLTTPVSTPNTQNEQTTVWLYNPSTNDIDISYETRPGGTLSTSTLTIPGGSSGGYLRQVIPNGYGARFSNTNGNPFYALATVDSTGAALSPTTGPGANRTWDWGFSLVPEESLTRQVLVGLGIGRDPTSATNPNENGAPIWVTPIGNGDSNVTIYVDYDSDPSTGSFQDPQSNYYDVAYTARELDILKIYRTNSTDQSGILIYLLDDDVKLAAAWGSDPATATTGQPGLDMGTGIPPLPEFVANKRSFLLIDADNDGYISPGDTLQYRIIIDNTGRQPVTDLSAEDLLPDALVYITNTTFFVSSGGVTNTITDNSPTNSPFPLDEGGYVITNEAALPVGGTWEIGYDTRVVDFTNLPPGLVDLENQAIVGGVGLTTSNTVTTPLYARIGDFVWWDADGDGYQSTGETGVNGTVVSLLTTNGTPVLDEIGSPITAVTTNDSFGNPGWYQLVGVLPGTYVVQFEPTSGYIFTTPDADGAGEAGSTNSNASIPNGLTGSFTVEAGETLSTIDAGLTEDSTIGDFVWWDADGDGLQDPGEVGLNGVTVNLLDTNGVAVLDANNDPISVVTTNNGSGDPGYYLFDGLYPDDYIVEFVPPTNTSFTTQDVDSQGVTGSTNSDADLVSGRSDAFTLGVEENLTSVDAGLLQADLVLTKRVSQAAVSEGSAISYTIAVSNAGPTLATGVAVNEPLTNGITYVTNAISQGSYNSGNGDWTVGSLAVGAVATLTLDVAVDGGTQGTGITNISQVTDSDMPDPVSSNNVDEAAIYVSALRISKTSDVGVSVIPGEPITYTIVVTNAGAVTQTNVVITDAVPAGTTYDPGSVSLDVIPSQPDTTNTVYDNFSARTYSNNYGNSVWNGLWQEVNEADGPLSGDAVVGTNGWAQIGNNRALTRAVNLSDVSNAVLSFVVMNDQSLETDNVRDEFSAQSYSNNDGSLNWNGDWSEGDPAGTAGPVGDYVGISGNRLTMHYTYVNDEWASRSADFTGYESAEFRFDWETVGLDAGETISVLVSSNGSAFVELEQLGGTGTGSRSYDISAYISATTTIRFENLSSNWESGEYAYFDNVEIVGARSVLTASDVAYVDFSDDGAIWNPVYAVTGMISGSVTSTVDVTSFATADSAVRFRTSGYTNANAAFQFDDVAVTYVAPFAVTAVSDPPVMVNGLSLPPGVSVVISFSATVDDPLDQSLWSITNTATVNSDLLPVPLPATVVDNLIPVDLGIGKSASPTVVDEGDPVAFTLSLTNFSSLVAATGVEVTDVIPTGFSFVSATPSVGIYDSTTGVWTVGTVATQGVQTLTLNVTATNGTAGLYLTNTTTISASEQADTNTLNNTARAVVLVRGADLALTKTVDNPAPNEGSEVTYTITVENLGPSDTTGVAVSEPLTNGVTYVSHSASQGSYNTNSGVWTVGALGTGDVVTLDVTVQVDNGTVGTTITNVSQITASDQPDTNPTNDIDSAQISVSGLRVTKVSDVDAFAYPGSNITYTIVVTNLGASAHTGLTVYDELPTGTTYVADSVQLSGVPSVTNFVRDEFNVVAFTNNDGTVDWANDWQEIGESNGADGNAVRVQEFWGTNYQLKVYNSARGGWRAVDLSGATSAELTYDYRISGFEGGESSYFSVSTNGGATWLTQHVWLNNVGITTSTNFDLTPYISSNTAVAFTNAAINAGGEGPEIDDIQITFLSPAGSAGDPPNLAAVDSLAPGEAFTITYSVKVDESTTVTQIVNTVEVDSDQLVVPVTDTVEDTVPYTDLGVVKVVDNPTPNETDTIVWTVTVTNNGPADTTGVVLSDLLPTGVTYVTNSPSAGSYASGSGIWTVGILNAGNSETLTITATVDPGTAASSITNVATITGNDLSDPNPSNDEDDAEIQVIAVDIGLGKSVSPPVPFEKEQLVYTISVTNLGPDTATGVAVTDQLPAALSYVSHSVSAGSYATNTSIWSIGTMAFMQEETLTLRAYVPVGTSGTSITNTASVTAVDQVDTNALNDTASVVVVPEEPPLLIDKQSDVVTTVAPEDTITYTITVTNQSGQTQTDVTVGDVLPDDVALVPGSVSVFGPVVTNQTFKDTFSALSFGNNNGDFNWTGNWIESEGDGPSSGDTRVWTDTVRGPYTVRFGGASKTLAREANLAGYSSATLSLVYRRDGLVDAADLVNLQVSSNGVAGTWTTVATYAGPATDGSYGNTSVDISSYIATNTAIRFSSPAGNTPGNIVWFDNVTITVPDVVYTNSAGGVPPTLASGYTLDPGDYLSITLEAEVAYLPTFLQLTNIAYVVSTQMTQTNTASVVDDVEIDYAALGGVVWFDGNGDGLQDAGETNWLENIPVTLLQIEGSVTNEILTSSTDAHGQYSFTNLFAGDYVVRWDLTTVTGTNVRVTSALQGTNETVDSDGEYFTSQPNGTGGLVDTRAISLDYGDDKDDVDLGLAYLLSTRAELAAVWGEWNDGMGAVVWRTSSEWNTAGFFLYAVDPKTGEETRLNDRLIISAFNDVGAQYSLADPQVKIGEERVYRLEEVERTGVKRDMGQHAVRFITRSNVFLAEQAARFAVDPMPAEPELELSGPSDRLTVRFRKAGIYGVGFEELATGLGRSTNEVAALAQSYDLVLSCNEQASVPYLVDNARTRIVFYGRETDSWYARDAAYQIQLGVGLPMSQRTPDPQIAAAPSVFPVVERFEQDVYPRDSSPVRPDDYYYWKYVISGHPSQGSQSFDLDLTGYDGGPLQLTVFLIGGSSTDRNPDHHATFTLNGTLVGSTTFDGRDESTCNLSVPESLVQDGTNTLTVTGLLDAGQSHSFFYIDAIQAAFDRALRSEAGCVHFQAIGSRPISAVGFSNALVLAIDNPANPEWLADAEGNLEPSVWQASHEGEAFALVDADDVPLLQPEIAQATSWLTDTTNKIDYLVITSRILQPTAELLAAYRREQGLRVGVTTFEDISDVFGHGLRSPDVIKWMLAYAQANWSTPPWMVLLAGNGHYDYLNTFGLGNNHIPPLLHATPDGLFAADSLFGDFDDDQIPDLAIGRLPARTSAELQAMIDKIKSYEENFGDEWQQEVILAADNTDAAGDFADDTEALAPQVPTNSVVARLYLDEMSDSLAKATLNSHINSGVGLIHYAGHGGRDNLSRLLEGEDVDQMNNVKTPLLVALSCLVGRFEALSGDSLGVQLMCRDDGGTVAVLGPSGLSYHASAKMLGEALFTQLYQESVGTLGVAFLRARSAVSNDITGEITRNMYNLLGDPALRIGGTSGSDSHARKFAQWRWNRLNPSDLKNNHNGTPGAPSMTALLRHYALGIDPANAQHRGIQMISMVPDGTVSIDWARRGNADDLEYRFLVSEDLIDWQEAPIDVETVSKGVGQDQAMQNMCTKYMRDSQNRVFFRLEVSQRDD